MKRLYTHLIIRWTGLSLLSDTKLQVTLEGDLDKAKTIDLTAPIIIGKAIPIVQQIIMNDLKL